MFLQNVWPLAILGVDSMPPLAIRKPLRPMVVRPLHDPALILDVVLAEGSVALHQTPFPFLNALLDRPAAMHGSPGEQTFVHARALADPTFLPCKEHAPDLIFT